MGGHESRFVQQIETEISKIQIPGGSESRFLIGHINRDGTVDRYLTVNGRNYGSRIVLGGRNRHDRYQKIKLQVETTGVYMRFDNHPQPSLRASRNDETVEMYNSSWDEYGEWQLLMTGVKSGNTWRMPISSDFNLDADNQARVEKFRVGIYNKGKNSYLGERNGEVVMRDGNLARNTVDAELFIQEGLGWEVEYVCCAWTAAEVTRAFTAPFAAVAAAPIMGINAIPLAFSGLRSIPGVMESIPAQLPRYTTEGPRPQQTPVSDLRSIELPLNT